MGTLNELRMLQALPLEVKIQKSILRIREYANEYGKENIYVAYSGGKDSTVLLHLVRSLFPETDAVFSNTGVEFPEILDFVKQTPNLTIVKPKMSFKSVTEKYGFPVVSKAQSQYIYEYKNTKTERLRQIRLHGNPKNGMGKISEKWKFLINAPFSVSHKCCDIIKKEPSKRYEKETGKHPIIGVMASESEQRQHEWIKNGCNSFELKRPTCKPLSFWTDEDIWEYIKINNIPYCKIYDQGYHQTGCMYCMYGLQFDKENRFEKMKRTHPAQYDFCMNKLGYKEVLEYIDQFNKETPIKNQMTIDDILKERIT